MGLTVSPVSVHCGNIQSVSLRCPLDCGVSGKHWKSILARDSTTTSIAKATTIAIVPTLLPSEVTATKFIFAGYQFPYLHLQRTGWGGGIYNDHLFATSCIIGRH